ncbi:hypothetical protein T03_9223 [Trichinella britovi]|uniref:Uncharacterized protein n=1 Tax=Trichinella britovi TaxID=45882 RepID=A0A0V1CQX5_TRIBR|nr:hypothetical protein T03_9223 [Trichinella britovi]
MKPNIPRSCYSSQANYPFLHIRRLDRTLVSDERYQHSPKCNNKKKDAADGDSQTANMLL